MLRDLTATTSSGSGILGTHLVGVLASELPTGFPLPGLLNNDVSAGDPAGCLYRVEITSWPSAGVLSVDEYGAFSFIGADGAYLAGETVYKYNPATGLFYTDTGTLSLTVGGAAGNASGANLTGVASITGGAAAGASAGVALGSALTSAGSIAGGAASGGKSGLASGAALTGVASISAGVASGTQPPQQSAVTVPASRTAKFAGRSRVVVFNGSKPVPFPKGPLDELYIVCNCTKDLIEANTTVASVAGLSAGVTVLEPPALQNGFPVVKLGALDLAVSRMLFTYRMTLANGEQVDRTIELTALDDRMTFPKDPDDRRFWALDFGADAGFGGTTLLTVSAPVVAGVTSLMTPTVANNQATVKVGGLDTADGAANSLGLWANFANTERIFRTIDFKQEDH